VKAHLHERPGGYHRLSEHFVETAWVMQVVQGCCVEEKEKDVTFRESARRKLGDGWSLSHASRAGGAPHAC
jgi:hypothetical protein